MREIFFFNEQLKYASVKLLIKRIIDISTVSIQWHDTNLRKELVYSFSDFLNFFATTVCKH